MPLVHSCSRIGCAGVLPLLRQQLEEQSISSDHNCWILLLPSRPCILPDSEFGQPFRPREFPTCSSWSNRTSNPPCTHKPYARGPSMRPPVTLRASVWLGHNPSLPCSARSCVATVQRPLRLTHVKSACLRRT